MENAQFQILFKRWCENNITIEEERELAYWFAKANADQQLSPLMKERWHALNIHDLNITEADSIKMANVILASNNVAGNSPGTFHRVHFLNSARFRWAAAIIVFIGIGTYIFLNSSQPDKEVALGAPSVKPNEILPGYSRAVLTLSNGKNIELDSATSETIRDGVLTIRNEDGQLSYKNAQVNAINTMRTPKGGQYQLTLADGTKVWLNAASGITYPAMFTGKSRTVSVTGEVYFEVAQNKAKPFIVNVVTDNNKSFSITVLGTSFNVNAYKDEQAKTSLLSGSIKINNAILKPGQAYINNEIASTNTGQDIAWKDGIFNFNNVDIPTMMRQLSRWYNIEVKYPNGIPTDKVKGEMGRSLTLQQVLRVLDNLDIKTTLKDRTLIFESKD